MSAELRNSKPIQDIGTLTAGSSCVAMIFSPILPTEPSSEKPTSWMGTRLPADEPGLTLLLTALGCSAVGLAIGGRNGALYGAMLGIGTGLASVAVATAATSPVTALTAQTMFLGLAAAGLGGQGGARVLRLAPMREPARPARHQDATSPPQTPARRRSRKK